MITSEEALLDLLNEFLLVSDNQLGNPVKSLFFSNNQEKLNNQVQELISAISKFKNEEELLLTNKGEQKLLAILNKLLINYYNSNDYYFNFKCSNNSFTRIYLPTQRRNSFNFIQYTLINIEGSFLINNDLKNTKEQIIKSLIADYIINDKESDCNIFLSDKFYFNSIYNILSLIFDEIDGIESCIRKNFLSIPNNLHKHYILSNKNIISSFFELIISNNDQINDWLDLYPGIISDNKSKLSLSDVPTCIDTILYSSHEVQTFLKFLAIEKDDRLDFFDGLLIKGENYTGLNYLKQSVKGNVDCIYIDPPYNTGSKDFLYNDTFDHSHYFWFMENRLSLAYDLLKDEGVIFISIDDNELVTVRQILDKKFIRVGTYVWHKKTQPSFLNKELISVTEYILVYKKNLSPIKMKGGLTDPNKHTELLNISNDVCKRVLPKNNTIIYNSGKKYNGIIKKGTYGNNKLQVILEQSTNVTNGVPDEDVHIQGKFRWTQNKIDGISNENRKIVIKSLKTLRPTVTGSGKSKIRPPISLLSKKVNDIPTNTDGNFEMKNLFKIPPFYYPKPVNLIKFLIDSVTYNKPEAIILDFFAGSGTTGEAVIELNRQDDGKRKFILIEEAEYFDTILIPRIKKTLFSNKWDKGIPLKGDFFEAVIKIIKLN